MSVGKNIAALRKYANLTQEQLAEKCNVSRQAVTKWETGESEPSIERLIILSEVFQVSIDELVTGSKSEMIGNIGTETKKINFRDVEMCIAQLGGGEYTNQDFQKYDILLNLTLLFNFLKYKYTDSNGNVYGRYLIENTTQEEREKTVCLINKFTAIQKYVEGTCEIVEVLDAVCDELFRKCHQINEIIERKRHSKEIRLCNLINKAIINIELQNVYTTAALNKLKINDELQKQLEQIREEIDGIGRETFWGRFFSFWEQEVNEPKASYIKKLAECFGVSVDYLLGITDS